MPLHLRVPFGPVIYSRQLGGKRTDQPVTLTENVATWRALPTWHKAVIVGFLAVVVLAVLVVALVIAAA